MNNERKTDIEQLIHTTISKFESEKFPKVIQNYKDYIGITSDRAKYLDEWQSNIHYPFISAIIDTIFSNIFDFSYSFNLSSDNLTKLIKNAFDFRDNGELAIKDSAKEALITGKGFIESTFYKSTSKHTVFGEDIEVMVKSPMMEYVSYFDIFYDSNYRIDASPFNIKRKFMSGKDIKNKYGTLIASSLAKKTKQDKNILYKAAIAKITQVLKQAQENNIKFSNYDYNPIKKLTSEAASSLSSSICVPKSGEDIEENNYFLRKDQKTYEVVEYNEGEDLKIYINGNIMYSGKQFIGGGLITIEEITFNDIPGTPDSRGQADRLGDIQSILNSVWNGFLDNIKLGLNPMFEVLQADIAGPDGKISFEKFKAIKVSVPGSIRRIETGMNDFTPLAITEKIESFGQKVSGVSTYMMGGDARVERVSGGIALKEAQYKSKLSPLVKSINRMMARVAKNWLLMYFRTYTVEELAKFGVEVKKEEVVIKGVKKILITIDGLTLEEILNEDNITFNIESLKSIDREAARERMKELLTILLQYGDKEQAATVNTKEVLNAIMMGDFDMDKIIMTPEPTTEEPQQEGEVPAEAPGEEQQMQEQAPQEELSQADMSNLQALTQ